MNRPGAVALLVVGVLLLVFGVNAYHSFSSGVSEAVTGAPTNKAIWLLAVGAISTVAGFISLARS